MTFGELVELACTKMHRIDAESVAEMRVYIKARYQMMWDSRPWKDALRVITLDPTVQREVILPAVVDRILCVRWGRHLLDPEHLITIFLTNPSLFDQTTNPQSYSVISPSGVEASPEGHKVSLFSDSANASFTVTIHGMGGNTEIKELIAISGTTSTTSVNAYTEIFGLSKTSDEFCLTVIDAYNANTLLDLWDEETSRMHQRIMLHTTPAEAQGIFILYKRRCNDLVNDSDVIQIRGLDNPLLAAGVSDMLEAQRHYGKAQIKAQEASILTQAAADLDVNQQANIIRIIPWDGGGDDNEVGGKGYW
jgi:hypothetical protein